MIDPFFNLQNKNSELLPKRKFLSNCMQDGSRLPCMLVIVKAALTRLICLSNRNFLASAGALYVMMRHYKSTKSPFFLFLYSPMPKQVLKIVTKWSMPLRQWFKHNNYHVTERPHVPRHSCFPVHVLFVVKADAVTRQPWPLPLLHALRIWLISQLLIKIDISGSLVNEIKFLTILWLLSIS